MTSRERVLKALRFEKPDRAPFEISWGAFTPRLMEIYHEKTNSELPPDEYFDFDTRSVSIGETRKKTDFSKYFKEPLPDNIVWDEWGIGAVPGSKEHFLNYKYHPLAECKTAEEVYAYEWPDIDADYRFEGLKEKIDEYKARGYAVMGEMYQTIFETAFLMRGMENLLTDFYENEEVATAICDKLTEMRINQARKYAELGVDIIRLGDDVATQHGPLMSREIYRKYIKVRMKKIIDAGREVNPDVFFFRHCDGNIEGIVEEIVEEGINILNPVQPECNDIERIYEICKDRVAFWGGIGTQSTMPFGTPEEVRAKVKEVQKVLGGRGALVLAPTHILEPEVPWENVLAFVDAAKNATYD